MTPMSSDSRLYIYVLPVFSLQRYTMSHTMYEYQDGNLQMVSESERRIVKYSFTL